MEAYLQILNYLEPHGVGKVIDISPVLLKIANVEDFEDFERISIEHQKIMVLLNSMGDQGFLRFTPFKPNKINGKITWIHNTCIDVSLDINGKRDLDNIKTEERVKQLNDSILVTNRVSRKMQRLSIGTSVVSLIFVFVTAFKACTDTTAKEIEKLTMEVNKLEATLKFQKTYQVEIKASNLKQHIPDTNSKKH